MSDNILFLGTGTSTGAPYLGCDCETCKSEDIHDKRLRSSALITYQSKRFLIDTGPDLRQQLLHNNILKVDAVLLTHEHYDHVGGLDDIRPLGNLRIYGEKGVLKAIRRNMPYSFSEKKIPGVPKMSLHRIDEEPFIVDGVTITPIRAYHGKLPILGFRVGDVAYLTDVKFVPEKELEKLKNLSLLVVNALREEPYFSHFNLQEALEFAKIVNAESTRFTHISHAMERHHIINSRLPQNIQLAHDNLSINF